MPRISAIGKYLDQPLLTAKINKNVPYMLTLGAAAIFTDTVKKSPKDERRKSALKIGTTLAATAISAAMAPKIASYVTGRSVSMTLSQIKKSNTEIVDEYVKNNNVGEQLQKILQKAKTKVLSLKEINKLFSNPEHSEVANKLIPPPVSVGSKDIFKEIGWLSVYGAIPVAGGIAGGVIGDKLTEKKWKDNVPNKLKEGIYQYLANIFLCNIGAGVALGVLEKMNIKSKSARCLGMLGGILLTGVIGGSVIANYIGKKIINPLVSKDSKSDTRTPELLDLSLHTDDIATISLLSGLKWIEPSLPLLYSISGYRAGIGYRNNKEKIE